MLTGEKLGRYEIDRLIGSGGMGEVYLATDEQLDRKVALKVLLPEFCSDEERVQRFKLEAKSVSALNHPNVITIHEIVQVDEKLFIAMEHVDGVTLRERIDSRDLSPVDSIKIAEQVANALSVTHEAGIIHRDIKPENIMIRHDGYAKILDFGLAKPSLHKTSGTDDATIQIVKTQPGLVMGSVRYMSPEQARGKETDERTDIWSLGVVFYEMLTGENPFEGETISDSIAALIHQEPRSIEGVTPELNEVLNRSLHKKVDGRYQNIRDFAQDLRELRMQAEFDSAGHSKANLSKTITLAKQDTGENKTLIHSTLSTGNASSVERVANNKTQFNTAAVGLNRGYMSLAAISLVVLLGLGAWFVVVPGLFSVNEKSFDSIQVSRLTDNGDAHIASVSPDGKLVAFVDTQGSRSKLVVRQVANGGTVEVVAPTEDGFMQPKFSHDGEFIYYTKVTKAIGTVNRVSTLGGKSKSLVGDVDSPINLTPDGKQFAFIRHNPNTGGDKVYLVDEDGGNLKEFISTKEVGFKKFNDAFWSVDGERLFISGYENSENPKHPVKVIAVSKSDKKVSEPEETKRLNEAGWINAYGFQTLKDGSGLVFVGKEKTDDAKQIWHLSFGSGGLDQITTDTSDYNSVSVSADGDTLIATKFDRISNLISYTPSTKESRQIIGDSRNLVGYRQVSQMPDGKVLFSRRTGSEIDIFSIAEDGSDEKQLTSDNKVNLSPVVTKDGKYILFNSNRDDSHGIWRMNSDGSGAFQLTKPEGAADSGIQTGNDGKTVFFARQTIDGAKASLMKVSIEGGSAEKVNPNSTTSDFRPSISPDGSKLAYVSIFYDSDTSEFESSINIVALDGEEVGETLKKEEFGLDNEYGWSADSKFLTYIEREGDDNLWNMSLDKAQKVQLTDFNNDNLMSFAWGNDGSKLFLVRGITNSDLVLIKDGAEIEG